MQKFLLNKKFILILKIYTIAALIGVGIWSYINKVDNPADALRAAIVVLILPFLGMALSINARKKQ